MKGGIMHDHLIFKIQNFPKQFFSELSEATVRALRDIHFTLDKNESLSRNDSSASADSSQAEAREGSYPVGAEIEKDSYLDGFDSQELAMLVEN